MVKGWHEVCYTLLKRFARLANPYFSNNESVECVRQWRATCGQLTIDLLTEESGRCVPLGPRPAVLQ